MKTIVATILFILPAQLIIGQNISLGYGPIYTVTNQRVKMINGRNDFQNTDDQFILSYEHFLRQNKVSFLGILSYFKGHTWIRFPEGSVIAPDGFPTIGVGYNGVNVYRIDLGAAYNLIDINRNFYLKPLLAIGAQISMTNGYEYGAFERQNGPDYVELEPISATTSNTTQIVPSVGLKTGFVLWKRIDVGLTFQGVMGFKPYQTMYFKYAYKGVPQETAIFDAKGTGLFCSLNVGYLIKKKK